MRVGGAWGCFWVVCGASLAFGFAGVVLLVGGADLGGGAG